MGYITKEAVAAVRAALKKEFPAFVFSVVQNHHSTLSVKIMKSDIDFAPILGESGSMSLNPYVPYREEDETCISEGDRKYLPYAKLFNKIVSIMKSQDWYDKSDSMTDYFNTAYYLSFGIGKWDKPYQKK